MKIIKKLNQRGDTIIEVMVVLAILSMAFGISYATANKGLNQSLNGEDHSEAVGIIDNQIEELRIAILDHPTGFPPAYGQYFCMTGNTTSYDITTVPPSSTTDSENAYSEYGSSCTFDNYYHVSISQVNVTNSTTYSYKTPVPTYCIAGQQNSCSEYSFTFVVRWDGAGGLGPQQESLTYRFGSGSLGIGIYTPPEAYSPPQPTSDTLNGIQGSCYYADAYICVATPNPAPLGPYVAAERTGNSGGVNDPCPTPAGDTYSCEFAVTYAFPSIAVQQSDANGYNLTICYTNYQSIVNSSGPPPASANYKYNIVVTDNEGGSFTDNLPTPTSNGEVVCTPLPGLNLATTTAPSSIKLDWTNDFWSNGDANFQINSVTLTANP
jgi:prepilin-type N-terminal cleavage/methylation domain-containing protein